MVVFVWLLRILFFLDEGVEGERERLFSIMKLFLEPLLFVCL